MEAKAIENRLLAQHESIAVDIEKQLHHTPVSYRRRTSDRKRLCKKLTKQEAASVAIQGLTPETDIFGFTRGQFSLIELIEAVLSHTGPAELVLSTWTAANADLRDLFKFLASGKVTRARFLLDLTFQRRQPAVAQAIRDQFGFDSIRIAKNHAKFFLIKNESWRVTCKTSMNLNFNPRFEDFDLSNDPNLFEFMEAVTNEIFKKLDAAQQARGTTATHYQEWKALTL